MNLHSINKFQSVRRSHSIIPAKFAIIAQEQFFFNKKLIIVTLQGPPPPRGFPVLVAPKHFETRFPRP